MRDGTDVYRPPDIADHGGLVAHIYESITGCLSAFNLSLVIAIIIGTPQIPFSIPKWIPLKRKCCRCSKSKIQRWPSQ